MRHKKLIHLWRRGRRELKIAFGDHYTNVRTEIAYLQKEIKQSMSLSDDRKTQNCWKTPVTSIEKNNKYTIQDFDQLGVMVTTKKFDKILKDSRKT